MVWIVSSIWPFHCGYAGHFIWNPCLANIDLRALMTYWLPVWGSLAISGYFDQSEYLLCVDYYSKWKRSTPSFARDLYGMTWHISGSFTLPFWRCYRLHTATPCPQSVWTCCAKTVQLVLSLYIWQSLNVSCEFSEAFMLSVCEGPQVWCS